MKSLKAIGRQLGFTNWARWGTHAFRRGKASETALAAVRYRPVAEEGDWSPEALNFLNYMASVHGEAEALVVLRDMAENGEDSDDDT